MSPAVKSVGSEKLLAVGAAFLFIAVGVVAVLFLLAILVVVQLARDGVSLW